MSIGSPPSTFNTIHPIDIKLGTFNKLHLCFQLSETTWCLIGLHGNNSQINDVTALILNTRTLRQRFENEDFILKN